MSVLCGWASIDERGKAKGGSAGDQTGKEVKLGAWYDFGQTTVLRFKDRTLAKEYAKVFKALCANDNVGYDQNQRTTVYTALEAVGWDVSKLNTPCETDCSQLTGTALNVVGVKVNKDIYTGNMVNACMATGKFDKLTDSKYLRDDDYLMVGDIIVKPNKHTITVLADGTKVASSSAPSSPSYNASNKSIKVLNPKAKPEVAKFRSSALSGTYEVTASELNMRVGVGTKKAKIAILPKGTKVRCYGYYNKSSDGTKWLYVAVGSYTGYCSSKYLSK